MHLRVAQVSVSREDSSPASSSSPPAAVAAPPPAERCPAVASAAARALVSGLSPLPRWHHATCQHWLLLLTIPVASADVQTQMLEPAADAVAISTQRCLAPRTY